eukprot:superscaffoldBa00002860_g15489
MRKMKAPFVHTYRLVNSTTGWSLQSSGIRLPSCRTLETLIENLRSGTASDVGLVPLTDPLDKTQLQEDFVYIEMCSRSSVY